MAAIQTRWVEMKVYFALTVMLTYEIMYNVIVRKFKALMELMSLSEGEN